MSDRILVQNSVPLVDVELPDGTTESGVALYGEFTINTHQRNVAVTPTVTAGAYGLKDAVGGLMTFADVCEEDLQAITIDSICVTDKSNTSPVLKLVLFDREVTTVADNAAFDVADSDLQYIIAVVDIAAATWHSFADNAMNTKHALGINADLPGTDIYGQLFCTATPTLASTSDITVTLRLRND